MDVEGAGRKLELDPPCPCRMIDACCRRREANTAGVLRLFAYGSPR